MHAPQDPHFLSLSKLLVVPHQYPCSGLYKHVYLGWLLYVKGTTQHAPFELPPNDGIAHVPTAAVIGGSVAVGSIVVPGC